MPVAELTRTKTTKAKETTDSRPGPAVRDRTATLAGATHTVLRIGAGLLFFLHGAPKLLGWFGGMGPEGGGAELVSLMGLAGIFEVFGGILIVLGLLTRPVAILLALEMVTAYFYAHAPRGPIPYANGGELALLYMGVWIFLAGNGPGPVSLDRIVRGRR
jgi:putative oxidoreductase